MTAKRLASISDEVEEQAPLPEGWRWVKLQDICRDISDGTHFTPKYISFGVPFLSVKDIKENGILFNSCRYISQEQHDQLCKRCKPERGDVLYTKVGTTGIAKAIDIDTDFSIFVSVALLKLKASVCPFFVEKALNSPIGKTQADNLTQGMANRNLVIRDIKTIKIPLPPTLEEQRRIATVLDEQMKAVEQARLTIEEQLKAAKLLPDAFLRSVFEGEDAQNWQKRKLGEVCESYTGTRDPRKTPETSFCYVDISSVDNINKRIIESRQILGKYAPSRARQVIFTKDVLVATTRPNLNAVALVSESLNDEICSTGFCVLRSTELIDSNYLFAFVQCPSFVDSLSDLVKGALYPAVTDKQVKEQIIPLPPIEKQIKLSKIINRQMREVESLKNTLTEQLEAIKKVPAALLRKAVAGEI